MRRVCVIGGGASGDDIDEFYDDFTSLICYCILGITSAWSLSQYPDKFNVELWEKESVTGGYIK